jgi:hypothetical protein
MKDESWAAASLHPSSFRLHPCWCLRPESSSNTL